MQDATCKTKDLTRRRWAQTVWMANTIAFPLGWLVPTWRPALWTVGLTAAGILCLVNAARCSRFHCYFTGPVFLAGAVLTFLRTLGLISLSWNQIGVLVAVGFALAWIPELLFGKYAGWARRQSSEEH